MGKSEAKPKELNMPVITPTTKTWSEHVESQNVEVPHDDFSFVSLLVELGQILTSKAEATDWLGMQKVSGLCRTHQYELRSRVKSKPGDLQNECQTYFGNQGNGDIRANGVKVSQRTDNIELRKARAPYKLKFERLNPNH
jgi:hypothetical protein